MKIPKRVVLTPNSARTTGTARTPRPPRPARTARTVRTPRPSRTPETPPPPPARDPVPQAVYWGLFAAWAANDIEELLTMAPWSRTAGPRLRARFPRVPERVWARMELTQPQVNAAVGLMAGLIAAAAADGARTGGRSPFFRTVLTGFGLHGAVHMAQSAAYRGYTPGVATSPTVVVPYSIWALNRLRRAGLPPASPVLSAALLPLAAGAAQALGGRLARRRRG